MSSLPSDFFFPAPRAQRFCSQCGATLHREIPPGDNRLRDLCRQCGAVHYQNPRMVVGTLPVWEGRILLCRRAIEPRYDTWTLPAGFMELDETTSQGALRETQEEAGARIELGPLYTVIDVPQVEQVHLYFLARALGPELDPGPESLAADWFAPEDIPWDELSFRTVQTTLEHYLKDLPRQTFGPHHYSLGAC
ncbi:FAD pyrophosphatase [plant metagenome]|uniref:FAD pyrophosphatase n=1 Tax=plant metagenome TaxID=1297885 RepID=A0A484V3F5_9ZZZZ